MNNNNFTFDTSIFAMVNPELANKLNKEMATNGLGFEGLGNVKITGNAAIGIINHHGNVYRNLKLLKDYMYIGTSGVIGKYNNKWRNDIYEYLTSESSAIKFYSKLKEVILSCEKQDGEFSIRKTRYEVIK